MTRSPDTDGTDQSSEYETDSEEESEEEKKPAFRPVFVKKWVIHSNSRGRVQMLINMYLGTDGV